MIIGLGAIFKLMHWPGSTIFISLGSLIFLLLYLPLWFINTDKKNKWVYFSSLFLYLFLTLLTYLFKSMHLPYAGVAFNIWMLLTLVVAFPTSIVYIFRSGKKALSEFHVQIILVLFVALIIGGIGSSSSRMLTMANSFSKGTNGIVRSMNKLSSKNEQMYNAFEYVPNKLNNSNYLRSLKLKKLSDSLIAYLNEFRINVISKSENVSYEIADTLKLKDMQNTLNWESITTTIWGNDDYEPIKGHLTGSELKSFLESYRDSIISFTDEANRKLIKNAINLNTEPELDEYGEKIPWIASTFRFINMPTFLYTMNSLMFEVRNAEAQVLSDLVANSKGDSEVLTLKVAELGAKLDNSMKEKEINELKSREDLAQIKMDAKNRELDSSRKTIIGFVIGSILILVLIFFIIRSNLIRKEMNKELAEQKHLIEEKNKEIIDSIRYAQRIQKAQMPTEKRIQNLLNRKS